MFGIRAKALFLYIALSCVLNEKGKTDSSAFTQLGCWFKDEKYKLETKDPIWIEDTPSEMVFDNLTIFQNFSISVAKAIGNVIEKHCLNDVDQFISFIVAYKYQTGNKKSLGEFFNDYHVPFEPLNDPVSFLMEINKELTALSYANVKDRMYIVSAYVDPPEKFVKDVLKYEQTVNEEMIKNQFPRHVAGIIKVKINYTFEVGTYNGIIIVDPGFISGIKPVNPYSVVSMEKSWHPYHGEILYPGFTIAMQKMKMRKFLHLRKKFALTLLTPSISRVPNPHKVLYLRNKQFCSFMDSTTKGNLLAPYHRIMSFHRDGSPKGYLEFNVVPADISNVSRPIFRLGTFDETTKEDLGRSFTFDSIEPGVIRSDIAGEIKKATNYLLLEPDYNLIGKLRKIQSEVFEDPDLVKDIYKLSIKLNIKPSEETKKPPNPSIIHKIRNLFQNHPSIIPPEALKILTAYSPIDQKEKPITPVSTSERNPEYMILSRYNPYDYSGPMVFPMNLGLFK